MKTKKYLLFASIMIASMLAFSGCNTSKAPKEETKKEETSKNETSENTSESASTDNSAAPGAYTLKDEVLFDDDKCKFVAKDVNSEGLFGPELNIYLENKTDQPLVFSSSNTSVNGYMLDPIFYEELEPNTNKVGTISFSSTELEKAGISALEEVQFLLNIRYSDNYDVKEALVNDTFSFYPTGKAVGELTYLPRTAADTDETVVDENDVKIVIVGLKKDDFWGTTLEFYTENNSDKTLNFTGNDVVVNNTSFDSVSTITISPGKKAYNRMYLSTDELEKNSISDIKEIKFKAKISDYSDPSSWLLDPILEKEISYTVK